MRKRMLALTMVLLLACAFAPGAAWAASGAVPVEIEIGSDGAPTSTSGFGWEYDASDGNGGTIFLDEGYAFTLTKNEFYLGTVVNHGGTIVDGVFGGTVTNDCGVIEGGSFSTSSAVLNFGTIGNGTFQGEVLNDKLGVIDDGVFRAEVSNSGKIVDGTFYGKVRNLGVIADGTFEEGSAHDDVMLANEGIVADGSFKGYALNELGGIIEGGDFKGMLMNHGIVEDGSFASIVTSENQNASIRGGSFAGKVSNYAQSVIEGGTFAGEVYNFGTAVDGTFEETVYNQGGGAIEGGRFLKAVHNDSFSTIRGGRFSWTVYNDGGAIKACDYLFTMKLTGLTHDVKTDADGQCFASYSSAGGPGLAFTLTPKQGYALPTSIRIECEPEKGAGLVPVADYSYNSVTGKVVIGNDAIAGALTVTANAPKAIDIATASVDPIDDQTYTGRELTPKPVVKLGGATLKESVDYSVSYKANTQIGTASVTIMGKGAYTGEKTVAFKIVERKAPSRQLGRLAGDRALDTMASITKQGFAAGSCDTVVVATMGGYWDALSASALAGLEECPILLTDGSSLSVQTASEIKRLGASKVYVVGGIAAVSAEVASSLKAIPGVRAVERLAGDIAVNTALEIYEKGAGSWGDTAIVATSDTFQDALSVSPYAYAKRAPIFLANASTHELDPAVLSAVKAGGFKRIVIVGGTAAISDQVDKYQLKGIPCKRLAGATAYETSGAIAEWCLDEGMTAEYVGVATGEDYYDALAGAALCGRNNSALVLVSDSNRSTLSSFVKPHKASVEHGFVFGGSAAVSDATYEAIAAALS